MPAAEMMTGVTMGEINRLMARERPGMAGLDSPRAASVPSAVARAVAAKPMTRLLASARSHSGSSATVRYQRRE